MNRKIILTILALSVLLSGCLSGENTGKGTLQITSSPSGAQVYLDGQFQGTSPCTIASVEPGNHTLQYRYTGYQSWSSVITVSPGTSNFFAALKPLPGTPNQNNTSQVTPAGVVVTARTSKDQMIVGDSMLFSGTCVSCTKVLLTLYGPGYYAKGISLEPQQTNSANAWSYIWNPGYTIQSGWYTLVAEDGQKTTSDRAEFSVVGGGLVSISLNSYSAVRGDTLRLSGRCTTGAQNVLLVLSGPDQFSGGVEIGSVSVTADQTWSFRYPLDSAMPIGLYTVNVYDIPKTAASSTQFTVRAL